MIAHFQEKSDNVKTGPIPVTTSPAYTCPPACPLRDGGCYAKGGPLGLHWAKVSSGERGVYWTSFLQRIADLPKGQLWRHNQAGDLPGFGDEIDIIKLAELGQANDGKRGFTYTHKPVLDGEYAAVNRSAIGQANYIAGFTVNLSANSLREADALADLGVGPVVAIVPEGSPRTQYTPKGRKGIGCPAQYIDDITCEDCGLCQRSDRTVVVLFWTHGSSKRKAEAVCAAYR